MNQTRRTLLQAILGLLGLGAAKAVAKTEETIFHTAKPGDVILKHTQFNIGNLSDKEMLDAIRRLFRRMNWTIKRGPIKVSPDLFSRMTAIFKKQSAELHWMPPLDDDGELRFKGCLVLVNDRLPKHTVRFIPE